jgi:hypothetical protein
MRFVRSAMVACLAAAGFAAAVPAWAHGPYRGGWRTGVTIGLGPVWVRPWPYAVPYAWDAWGPWGAWGVPPVVVGAPPQVVYVERPDAAAVPPAPPAGYWYWCAEAAGWYPAVPTCPSAWVAVPPQAAR